MKKGDQLIFSQGPLHYVFSPRCEIDPDLGIDIPVSVIKLTEAGNSIASLYPPMKRASRECAEGLLRRYSKLFDIEVRYAGNKAMPLIDFLRAATDPEPRKT